MNTPAQRPDDTLLSASESTEAGVGMLRAVPQAASLVDLPSLDGSPGAGASDIARSGRMSTARSRT